MSENRTNENQAKATAHGGGTVGISQVTDDKIFGREKIFKTYVERLNRDVKMYGTEIKIGSQTFELYPRKDYADIDMIEFFINGYKDFLTFTTTTFERLLKSYLIPHEELERLQGVGTRSEFFPTARHPILVKDGDEDMMNELSYCVKPEESAFWFYDFEEDFLDVTAGIVAEMKFARWLVYLAALNDSLKKQPGVFSDVKVYVESLGKTYEYFMTDSITIVQTKLNPLGYRNAKISDWRLNPALMPEVRERMIEYGTQFSMTFSNGASELNWYRGRKKVPYIVYLDELKI